MTGRITAAIPILPARDMDEATAFYAALGFRAGLVTSDYVIVVRDGVQIHLWRCTDRHLAENTSCYIHADDLDALHADMATSGIAPAVIGTGAGPRMSAPMDRDWGMREFYVWDPSGNLLRIGQDIPRSA